MHQKELLSLCKFANIVLNVFKKAEKYLLISEISCHYPYDAEDLARASWRLLFGSVKISHAATSARRRTVTISENGEIIPHVFES